MRATAKQIVVKKQKTRNVAFQFRKPVKAAHIKDALFYLIGFCTPYVGRRFFLGI